MTRRRVIAVVTGSRAEYGLLRSTMRAIAAHPELKLRVIATGTHLLRRFGHAVNDIVRDGFRIDARVKMQRGNDAPLDQAQGISLGIAGIAPHLAAWKVDVVLVLGDRIEAMAGALAGITTGRFVAHIHGGDTAPGDIDESIRHAISKLSHIHFPASKSSRKRLLDMGERNDSIFMVGPPAMDEIREVSSRRGGTLGAAGNLAIVLQHPCGRPASVEKRVMNDIITATLAAGLHPLVIEPNSDRGHSGIRAAIRSARSRMAENGGLIAASLERTSFLHALADARVLIGNSSSGIIEAPLMGTPSINVGDRQRGRERYGNSVIDCGESPQEIARAIRKALSMRRGRRSTTPGSSISVGQKIADHLSRVQLDEDLRRKGLIGLGR